MRIQFHWMLVVLSLVIGPVVFSQTTFDAPVTTQSPNILPPTPDAFSFTKYGSLPIGLNTGTAQYSFPVYTIQSGKLSHAITLSYSSNGVKVDEMATRTGINWRLAAGGVITRAVLDKPDGEAGITPTFYHGLTGADSTNHELFTYVRQASDAGAPDFQPDEYSFNMDGYSGKFLKRENGEWGQLNSSAVKIEKNSSGFILTAPNGVKYFFYAVERSKSYSYPESYETLQHVPDLVPTSWYLTKILSPYKDSIVFNYTSLLGSGYQTYKNGIVQDYSCKTLLGGAEVVDYTGGGIADYPQPYSSPVPPGLVTTMNYSDNEVQYLSSINFNNGRVDFLYSSRDDVPGEKRLDTIKVVRFSDSSLVRCVKLSYTYSRSLVGFFDTYIVGTNYTSLDTALKKRLFLTGIDELAGNQQPLLHTGFEYDNMNSLPPRLSFSQDRFGSFNGKVNSVYFIPNDTWFDKLIGNNRFGGDRSYDFNSAKIGMLKVVRFPTGGFSTYEYEPNKTNADYAYVLRHDSIYAIADTSTYSGQEFLSDTIHFTAGQELHLHGFCDWASSPVYTIVDGQATDLDDAYHVNVDLIDVNSNTCVNLCGSTINPGEQFVDGNFGVSLPSGTYRLKLTANRARLRAMIVADKQWKENDRSTLSGIDGVRVKTMEDYTADSLLAGTREYLYGDWSDSTSSSGYGLAYDATNGHEVTFVRVEGLNGISPVRCGYNTIHSNSTLATYLTDNNTVLYNKVIELHTSTTGKNNGGTEYEFCYDQKQISVPLSYSVPFDIFHAFPIVPVGVPWSNSDFLSGKLKSTRQFSYAAKYGSRNVLSELVHYYSVDTAHWAIDTFLVSKKVRASEYFIEDQTNALFSNYDMGRYWRYYGFVKLDSTIETDYDASRQLASKTIYNAYSPVVYQPTDITTYSSKNQVKKTIRKYASDVQSGETGYDIYSGMANLNMVEEPIAEKHYTDNVDSSGRLTPFTAFIIGGVDYYLPTYESSFKGAAPAITNISYQDYDAKGDLLQYTAKDGVLNSFIWDYNNQYPIAKAVNANDSSIAYTSFEADGSGGWTIGSSSRDNSTAITGKQSYNLSNGNLSKGSLSSGKIYIISYWSTNGAKTISGGSGSSRTGWAVNGWTYYEHTITASGSTIAISGSGSIDEVRLCPKDAQMTTYTYEPLIGVSSIADANGEVVYYEYDNFNRLKFIKDFNGNIIKSFQYNIQH